VGRWLEHSRIYSFGEGEDQRLFIGSGDLLSRNLEHRVEAFIEAVTPDTREQLNVVLDALRRDKEKSRRMLPDGSYIREPGGEGTSSQEALYRYFSAYKVGIPSEQKPAPAPAAPPVTAAPPKPAEPAPVVASPKALETAPPSLEHMSFLQKLKFLFS
jgi:polyphosphate kinase